MGVSMRLGLSVRTALAAMVLLAGSATCAELAPAQTPLDSLRQTLDVAEGQAERASIARDTVVEVDTLTILRVDTLTVFRVDTLVVRDTIVRVDTVVVVRIDTVYVTGPQPPPLAWDVELRDTLHVGTLDLTGLDVLIGPNVQVRGVLLSDSGTIFMRPGSDLTFIGLDSTKVVGGGMRYDSTMVNDYGIFCGGVCQLDIQGTPKTGWTREGCASDWACATDEMWIAPTATGNTAASQTPRRWYAGDSIPQVDPRVPAAEIANVTRDVNIRNGHIHISSKRTQRIEYAALHGMGIFTPSARFTSGRYALHFHMMGLAAEGSVVRGVASINARGRVYVPHQSHGIQLIDNVAVNSRAEVFWWDSKQPTNNTLVEGLLVMGSYVPASEVGETPRHAAVVLNGGTGNVIRHSTVTGARGSSSSHAFNWPSSADNVTSAVWGFGPGNVAHNNEGACIRLWFNDIDPHIMDGFVTYRCEGPGIENGAYGNAHRYLNGISLDNMVWHSGARVDSVFHQPAGATDLMVEANTVPLTFGVFNKGFNTHLTFERCSLINTSGGYKVAITDPDIVNAYKMRFIRCGMVPSDILISAFPAAAAGSEIIIEHEDGRIWRLTPQQGALHGHVDTLIQGASN